MEKIKQTILHFGRPNDNGKVYDANDFQMPSQVPVLIQKPNGQGVPFNEQVGTATLAKNGAETLEAEITLSGAHYDFAKEKLNAGFKFVASGEGQVDESGYIREYRMLRIIMTDKPANSY